MSTRPKTLRRASGFSLLEVLVASAIMATLTAILLGTLSGVLGLWRLTDNKVTADREGRSAQLLLSQDLGNAIMPTNPALWPRVASNGSKIYLQFLTAKPRDYQEGGADAGDICFVEYFIDTQGHHLMRNFLGSANTYTSVLSASRFPSPGARDGEAQLVADNLLVDNRDAARRMALNQEANTNHFVILGANLMPISGSYSAANRPALVEFNIAAVDPQTATNKILLDNSNILLRSAALFSSRIKLPSP